MKSNSTNKKINKKLESINYLRFIACFLIVNSHLKSLYPSKLSFLSFGGFFGNCIFFFVSGYCLNNIKDSFVNWFKRRLRNVYIPYLFFIPILLIFGQLKDLPFYQIIMPFKKYHFIPTILIIYIVYYFCNLLNKNKIFGYGKQLILVFLIQLAYYALFFDYKNVSVLTRFSFPEMTTYLFVEVFGSFFKERNVDLKKPKYLLLVSIATFFLYVYQSVNRFLPELSILQLYIGTTFSISFCELLIQLEGKLPNFRIVNIVSKSSLEVYLVHLLIISGIKNVIFPLNIIITFISSLLCAVCLKAATNCIIKKRSLIKRIY